MKSINSNPISVTAGEISRNFGHWQDRALESPVIVTHHGRPRVAVLSAGLFFGIADNGAENASLLEVDSALPAILHSMFESFVSFDESLKATSCNDGFRRLLGAGIELGTPWDQLFPATRQATIGQALLKALRSGEVVEFEAYLRGQEAGGFKMRALPYPGGVGLLIQDKNSEEEMKRRLIVEKAYSLAIASLDEVGIAHLDRSGVFDRVEASFSALVGFAEDELVGLRLVDFISPTQRAFAQETLASALHAPQPALLSILFFAKGANDRWLELSISAVRDDEVPTGLVLAATPMDPPFPDL